MVKQFKSILSDVELDGKSIKSRYEYLFLPYTVKNSFGLSYLRVSGISRMVEKVSKEVGLHDPNLDQMEDHFSLHCCRHWFTTHFRGRGCPVNSSRS
jgi:integrase